MKDWGVLTNVGRKGGELQYPPITLASKKRLALHGFESRILTFQRHVKGEP